MASSRFSDSVNIKNRKASFTYSFVDKYVAGIVLSGTEIKSIKEGKVSLQEGYCYFHDGELYVKGMNIAPYAQGTIHNHDPLRERKLLMKKTELRRLASRMDEKGLTLVPVRLFINDRGYAKLEVALAKGKKLHDKRETIREREVKRDLSRYKS